MEYNLSQTIRNFNHDKNMSFLFFWGHQPNPDGSISDGCFSQWWPSTFVVDGITYNCAEQYMMAEKARTFPGNEKLLNDFIMKETNPHNHKKYGRQVKNYDDEIWAAKRKEVVLKGNIAKFSQNEELKNYLLNTGDKVLVEASPYDNIWGIKMKKEDLGIDNPNKWKGTNLLGFVLMQVRDTLRMSPYKKELEEHGYRLIEVYANFDEEVFGYGDIYENLSDCQKEHPMDAIMFGYYLDSSEEIETPDWFDSLEEAYDWAMPKEASTDSSLYGNISSKDIKKVGGKMPEYQIGEIVDLNTWTGMRHDYKIIDIKVTYHYRLNRWTWGYKLYKQNQTTGFSFEYIPEGYLRKKN